MKKIILISTILLSFAHSVESQMMMSVNGGLALPGRSLLKYNYPNAGYLVNFDLYGGILNKKHVRLDAGFNFGGLTCGDKTYSLSDGKERIYNTVAYANVGGRLVFNAFKWKPYFQYAYGFLGTGFNDQFTGNSNYSNNTSSGSSSQANVVNNNPTNVKTSTNTWNQMYTVGTFYEINDVVELQMAVTYQNGGPTAFIDFSKVTSDKQYVYSNVSMAPSYEMFTFTAGINCKIKWDAFQNARWSGVQVGGYGSSFRGSSSTGVSHLRVGPHR